MGYELYWAGVPVGQEPLCHSPEHGCFELVEWDMAATCHAMDQLGMLDPSQMPTIGPELFGLTSEPEFYEESGARIEYHLDTPEGLDQRALIARQRGDTGGRIPLWKLASNDAWLVTSQEIERSLQAYARAIGHPDAGSARERAIANLPWWSDWITFLRDAIEHDGVEVY